MMTNKLILGALLSVLFLSSCSNDEIVNETVIPLGKYEKGIIVLNEGGFQKGNSSVSYISSDLSVVENDVFSNVNKDKDKEIKLGDTGQSMAFYKEFAFIMVNASNKIEVVNRYTFKSVATITSDIKNPRYMAIVNGKGYVTNWGDSGLSTDDYVAVLDLNSFTVTSKIAVKEGPEEIKSYNNKVYVAHKGGWGFGNILTVLNSATNTINKTIAVGDLPISLDFINGSLKVLCSGIPSWTGNETKAKLITINLSNDTVESTLDFPEGEHPKFGEVSGTNYYYTSGQSIYKMNINDKSLPTSSLFDSGLSKVKLLYGFNIINDTIFIADGIDNSSNGEVFVFTTMGSLIKKIPLVGVLPNGFYFNE